KRHHHELGWFAREALRNLDALRVAHGRPDEPLPTGPDGGTLHADLTHPDPSGLPVGFRAATNAARTPARALGPSAEGRRVVLVSKDIPLRVKASAVGLRADGYHAQDVVTSGWTGMVELDVASTTIDQLYAESVIDLDQARELPCHTGIRLLGSSS